MLYLYLFDYTEAFLPFIHTICPMQEDKYEDTVTKLLVSIQNIKYDACLSYKHFKIRSIKTHDVIIHFISLHCDFKNNRPTEEVVL